MKRDLGNMIATFSAFAPMTIGITGATGVNGYTLDRFGYESILFVFTNGTTGHGAQATLITITGKIQESSDTTNWSDVSGATATHNITNTYSTLEVPVADATVLKRYVRGVLSSTITGAGNIEYVSGVAVFGSSKNFPV